MARNMCSGNKRPIHLFIQQIFVKCLLVPTIILGARDAKLNKTDKNLYSCKAFILWEESDNKQDKPGKHMECLMIIKCHGEKLSREECKECWERTASLRMWHLGAPGWLSQLSIQLRFRSWSHGSWVRAPGRALHWQPRAWSLHWILCLPLSALPLLVLCLSLSLKNKH